MKVSFLAVQLLVGAQCTLGFAPLLQQVSVQSLQSQQPSRSTPLFSTQWDDEDEDIVTAATSFEDAGENLKKEDEQKKMGEMEDFDSNPAVSCQRRNRLCWSTALRALLLMI